MQPQSLQHKAILKVGEPFYLAFKQIDAAVYSKFCSNQTAAGLFYNQTYKVGSATVNDIIWSCAII